MRDLCVSLFANVHAFGFPGFLEHVCLVFSIASCFTVASHVVCFNLKSFAVSINLSDKPEVSRRVSTFPIMSGRLNSPDNRYVHCLFAQFVVINHKYNLHCEKNEMVLGRAYQPPQRRPMDLARHHMETI